MTLLKVESVCKEFIQGNQVVKALQQVSFVADKSEFVALVGPSGSGKTTLLNLIGGLDNCTEGIIAVAGKNIAQLNDAQLSCYRLFEIGFVFQAYNLVPVLSALENVELIMILQGKPPEEVRRRASEYLSMVGLASQLQKRPAQMSGGQQQRVAVARALAGDPKIILADEPTANLDSANASALLDIMYRLCKERQKTFIFSTHDSRVMERAERILTLTDGQIVDDKVQSVAGKVETV